MSAETVSMNLTLAGKDLDSERSLNALQADLEAAPHLSVTRKIIRGGGTASGAKGSFQDITLLVTASLPALHVAASVVRAWIKSKETRSLKLEIDKDAIELSGPWSKAHDRALSEFLERHSDRPPVKTSNTISKKNRRPKRA